MTSPSSPTNIWTFRCASHHSWRGFMRMEAGYMWKGGRVTTHAQQHSLAVWGCLLTPAGQLMWVSISLVQRCIFPDTFLGHVPLHLSFGRFITQLIIYLMFISDCFFWPCLPSFLLSGIDQTQGLIHAKHALSPSAIPPVPLSDSLL